MAHVFVFTRDLRLADNPGLLRLARSAARAGRPIIPVFLMCSQQADPRANPYHSSAAVRFMLESLADLAHAVPALRVVEAPTEAAGLDAVAGGLGAVAAVGMSADATPYARRREEAVAEWCRRRGAELVLATDTHFLVDPSAMDRPYRAYAPFLRRFLPLPVPRPAPPPARGVRWAPVPVGVDPADRARLAQLLARYAPSAPPCPAVRGGRAEALATLRAVRQGAFARYHDTRERPALPRGTTRLSAALKSGCVSVREAYHAVVDAHGSGHALVRELFWRAFYDQLTWHAPELLREGNAALRPSVDARASWRRPEDAPDLWAAWCEGRTGFPFVDAGMRQMLATGWMHNRARMVCASFLAKQLGFDWRAGERFFAQHLVDYHPAANSGGWQWSAGVGADAQPFTRIFNPWLQARRYDPDESYIREHVPELRATPPGTALAWDDPAVRARHAASCAYPPPCVDHRLAARAAADRYRRAAARPAGS